MGGLSSGYRAGRRRKATVEESRWLSISDLRDRLMDGFAGGFVWKCIDGRQSSIDYRVNRFGIAWIVTLSYRLADIEAVEIPVRLQTTPTQFGGQRWWFTCPLIVNGVACCDRVGKLYLPPGAKYFGCRTCHRLTYRSSQEAHKTERLATTLERMFGCDRNIAETVAARWRGKA